MKEHIAACSESGIIYGTVAAPANEHDITHLGDLLKGLEKMVFLDSGYIGCAKRTEIQAIPFKDVSWYIAAKPSAWKKELSISENFGGELGQALVECVNVGSSSKAIFNFALRELLSITRTKFLCKRLFRVLLKSFP